MTGKKIEICCMVRIYTQEFQPMSQLYTCMRLMKIKIGLRKVNERAYLLYQNMPNLAHSSRGAFTNYIEKILSHFDYLPPDGDKK